jgi:hypothetical protein
MLEILAGVHPCTTHPFDALRHLVLDRHTSLSGAVCVLLGWDADRRLLVEHLEARGLPTLTLVIGERRPGADVDAGPGSDVHFLAPGRIAEGLARL